MRGFPLFNTLLVAFLFFLAWWPLRQLATSSIEFEGDSVDLYGSESNSEPAPEGTAAEGAAPVEIRVFSSSPLARLRVESLGQPVIDQSDIPGEITHEIESLRIPPEGIEFWVEAEFAERPAEGRVALGIEVAPSNRDSLTRTLWSA